MKLPYQVGDIFALPLGDGHTARALIVVCEHRAAIVRVYDTNDGTIATLRVSDDALVAYRWKRIDHGTVLLPIEAENRSWMHAARAERVAASRLGVAMPIESRSRVIEVRDDAVPSLAQIDGNTTLSWSAPLSTATLERIGDLAQAKPLLRARLSRGAVEQLQHLATWPLTRLTIDGACERVPSMPQIRELDLFSAAPLRSFPHIVKLRIYGRRGFDARDLLMLPHLTHLELNSVQLEHPNRLLNCPALRILRCSHATGLERARHVALPQLQTLELNHTGELAEIKALGEMQQLDQLQLRGFWQHDIPEMEWLLTMRHLKRAEIDIGGRRKNIELYRRASWAYPWPL